METSRQTYASKHYIPAVQLVSCHSFQYSGEIMKIFNLSTIYLTVILWFACIFFLSCTQALPAPDSELSNLDRALAAAPNAALIFNASPSIRQRLVDSFPVPAHDKTRFTSLTRIAPLVCTKNRDYLADTAAFFDELRADYPGYAWYGGDTRWDQAFAQVLSDLAWRPTKCGYTTFLNKLNQSLGFVEDRHFWVNGRQPRDMTPRMASELACLPAGSGWLVLMGGETRLLAHDPANAWFMESLKPGLREDGSIAWFSVLPGPGVSADAKYRILLEGAWSPMPEWRELNYQFLTNANGLSRDFAWEERDGIGILRYPKCQHGDGSAIKGFRASAERASNKESVLIDLRGNFGGSSWAGQQWVAWFWGNDEPTNAGNPFGFDRRMGSLSGFMTRMDAELSRFPYFGDTILIPKEKQAKLSLVLIDGAVCSSGEFFANDALAGQHSLAVGANSGGYIQFGNVCAQRVGPKQILSWRYGTRVFFGFEGGAKEGVGIRPALYCPPDLAESRSLAFLRRFGADAIKRALEAASASRSAEFLVRG